MSHKKNFAELTAAIGVLNPPKIDSATKMLLRNAASPISQAAIQAALKEHELFAQSVGGFGTRVTDLARLGVFAQAAMVNAATLFKDPSIASINKAFEGISRFQPVADLSSAARVFEAFRSQLDAGVGGMSVRTLADLQSTFGRLPQYDAALQQSFDDVKGIHSSWLREYGTGITESGTSLRAMFNDVFGRSINLTALTQGIFDRIEPGSLGATIGIGHHSHLLEAGLRAFTDSYGVLAEELASREPWALPRIVIEQPPHEVFIHAKNIAGISPTQEPGADDSDLSESLETLRVDAEQGVMVRLERLGPDFVRRWRGAREALASRNPDRITQASASARELFRLVLHELAPTDAVKRWTSLPNHFANGRPTRQARFEFITRHTKISKLAPFLRKDYGVVLELVTFFNQGVHEKEVPFTDADLRLLLLRLDAALSFLIEIADTSES